MDLDGDGDTDVVTAAFTSISSPGTRTTGRHLPVWTLRVIDSSATNADGAWDIEAVDVDGDGDIDVVTAAEQLRSVRLVRERRVDTPRSGRCRVIDNGMTNADDARDIDAVDLDGDGDIDVVTAAYTPISSPGTRTTG